MATQTFGFQCTSGETVTIKLFKLDPVTLRVTDTEYASADATELENALNEFEVTFTDCDAGWYSVNGFIGDVGGNVNESVEFPEEGNTGKAQDGYFPIALRKQNLDKLQVTVTPLTGIIQSGVNGTDITAYTKESKTVSIAVVDASGNAVDVEGLTLRVVIEDRFTTDIATITDGSITKADNTVTFTIPNTATTVARQLCWSLRKTDESLLLTGIIDVVRAPSVDS